MRTGVGRWAKVLAACLPVLLLMPGPTRPMQATSDTTPTTGVTREPASTSTSPPVIPQQPKRRWVTVALTGDVLVHDSVWQSARDEAGRLAVAAEFDFRPMLAPIRPIIAHADLAICHLETPLAPPSGPYASYPVFSTPQEIVAALRWAGHDACSTGSNHSVDQGDAGLVRTLRVLDRIGLRHTGTSRSPAEAHRPVIFDVDGIRIGWLEYTSGTNGIPVHPDKPWSVNLIDPDRILRDARLARWHGADAVLVGLHWGDEYQHSPSRYQLDLARRLTRSPDLTLVYGHHAHVVQPIRRVHGTWVLFGLGNLLADQAAVAPGVDRGLIGLVTLTRTGAGPVRVTKVASVSTRIYTSGKIRVRPVGPVHPVD